MNEIPTSIERRIDRDGPVPLARPDLGACWIWIGSKSDGYGRVTHRGKRFLVHRFVYEHVVGTIVKPQLDHLCRVRACCNPKHLEQVTNAENIARGETGQNNARKTHCPSGHAYDEQNTIRTKTGRVCKTCMREKTRAKRAADPGYGRTKKVG